MRFANKKQQELIRHALSAEDLTALPTILSHADIIGLLFLQRPQDLADLDAAMEIMTPASLPMPIALEIETPERPQSSQFNCHSRRIPTDSRHDRTRRPCGGTSSSSSGRNTGRNVMALRGGIGSGCLGHPNAGPLGRGGITNSS